MESWIDDSVLVAISGESEPLKGTLEEVGITGIIINTENKDAGKRYPNTEAVTVLAFVPMSKIVTVMLIK